MTCPSDLEWMEFLEGLAPSRAREYDEHCAACAPCRDAVSAARSALAALTKLSPGGRRLCPPPEELEQAAGGVGSLRVRLHVALCADCREDLADLAALSEETPGEVVARWLADGFRVVSQTLSGAGAELVPALVTRAGPDGRAGGWRLRQELEGAELALELAPGENTSFGLAVSLAPKPAPGTRVDLEAGGRLLESRAMDASGVLSFLALPAGRYRVTVRRPSASPVVTELDVG